MSGYQTITVTVCDHCLHGVGGRCLSVGCIFFFGPAPDWEMSTQLWQSAIINDPTLPTYPPSAGVL